MAEEVVPAQLAEEADALTVLARLRGKVEASRPRHGTHVGLGVLADGEEGTAQLLLAQRRQEVGLVF